LRQSDLDAVRKLLRDGIAFGYDKVLRDSLLFSTTSTHEEDVLYAALRALVDLAALLLELRCAASQQAAQQPGAAGAAAQLFELDGELLQLVILLAALFARDTPLHEYHSGTEPPLFEEDDPAHWTFNWAQPIVRPGASWRGGGGGGDGTDDEDERDEDEAPPEEGEREHDWLVYLINRFGDAQGFNCIHYVRGGWGGGRTHAVAGSGAEQSGGTPAAQQNTSSLTTFLPRPPPPPPPQLPQLLGHFPQTNLSVYMVSALIHVLARVAELMPDSALPPFQEVGLDRHAPASYLQAAVQHKQQQPPPIAIHNTASPPPKPTRWSVASCRASPPWPRPTTTSSPTRARTAPTRRCARCCTRRPRRSSRTAATWPPTPRWRRCSRRLSCA
jgi:hypothetical protein